MNIAVKKLRQEELKLLAFLHMVKCKQEGQKDTRAEKELAYRSIREVITIEMGETQRGVS